LVTTALDEWFISHVLPLEGLIHAFLRRHGHEDSEIPDLRQEAYACISGTLPFEAGHASSMAGIILWVSLPDG